MGVAVSTPGNVTPTVAIIAALAVAAAAPCAAQNIGETARLDPP